jgi:hypothetical protein
MIHAITQQKMHELRELIGQLSEDQFSQPLEVLSGSTLGMHLRHILEFYQCLFQALEDRNLNYDLRKRDKEMETSKARCQVCISQLMQNLKTCTEDIPLQLSADYSGQLYGEKVSTATTYFRELLYNIEHCVHHLAIIRIGMKALDPSLRINGNMGIAASTLRNANQCAQ